MRPDLSTPRTRIHTRGRLLLALGVITFAGAAYAGATIAGTSLAAAQGARSTYPAQPQSEPAEWAPTFGPHVTGITETEQSYNWSGYIDTGSTFTAASAQWIVPAVQPSSSALYSSTWVGVDGATDNSLIQTGTTQETNLDTTYYFAWYEILPAAATEEFIVSPGDQMESSVQEDSPGTWTIAITDSTSGQSFSSQFAYSGPQSSAEWIEEAPTVNNQQAALADFGTAQFTDVSYTASNPGSVTPTPVDMIDTNRNVIASPGAISNNTFTVTDDEAGPPSSPAATSTRVSVNPTSSTSGSTVTYTATVTSAGGTPTGTVTFTTGSTALCTTGNLVSGTGSCSATSAPVGDDTITGAFGGNSNFSTSSGTTTLDVAAAAPPPPPPPANHGYWLVGSDGGIFTFGSAQFHGSTGNLRLQRPVVGITLTADRGGYWLVASDGGVFTFGDAGFVGSIPGLGIAPAGSGGGKELNAPIVGMVPTSNGGGYFLVGSDGGVFAFGDAKFEGSCPGIGGCSGAAVTVMPDASGNGYWLVTATGHVYTFGDAVSYGSPGPQNVPVTSAVRTPSGQGYWILFANGTVDDFGNAANLGDPANETGGLNPATAIFATSDGGGYWVSSANGTVFSFGDAPNDGGMAGTRLNGSIIAAAGF
jgi:hypothetical protein